MRRRLIMAAGMMVMCLRLLMIPSPAAAAATTSGTISADEAWSGTIDVTGDVTVAENVVLRIEPGTTINFADNTGLHIYGKLDALGASDTPITFTSASATPSPGKWSGIFFYDSSQDASTIDHAVIEYASMGVWCDSANPSIINSAFSENDSAIYLSSSSSSITGCTILGRGDWGSGIFIEGNRSPQIINNHIAQCWNGIYAYENYSPTGATNLLIRNNVIRYSAGYGIFIDASISSDIRFNTLYFNRTGISLDTPTDSAYTTTLNSNIITSCETGIERLSGNYSLAHNDLWDNQVSYSGLEPGETDLSADPLFVDPQGDDFHLQAGSPLLGAGENGQEIGAYGDGGKPPTLIVSCYSTELTTSGTLACNEIWSGEVEITGDVSVPLGNVLRIEPGTIIRFADYTGLHIYGTLQADSTPENPITFTSSSATPTSRIWEGVHFYDSSRDLSSISNAVIEYASTGVHCEYANPSISSSVFSNNDTAISLYASTSSITGCTLKGNGENGISLFFSAASVSGCTIQGSGERGNGIFIASDSSAQNITAQITNNHIAHLRYGIYAPRDWQPSIFNSSTDDSDHGKLVIRNNIIRNNAECGIAIGSLRTCLGITS